MTPKIISCIMSRFTDDRLMYGMLCVVWVSGSKYLRCVM